MSDAAEIIAKAVKRFYTQRYSKVAPTVSAEILDALMAGHSDVHLHRNPDGTVSVTPMQEVAHIDQPTGRRLAAFDPALWVDVEAGAP